MAWRPIAGAPPQIDASDGTLASGYFLKFYASGTTTPINMATDSTGGTTLAKCQINASGYPINGSSAVFIPYIDQKYRLVLYTNATDADANTFGNADWDIDTIDYAADIRDELANTSNPAQGDAQIGLKKTLTNAEASTVHAFNEKRYVVMGVDYGASLSADGVDNWYTVLNNAMTDVNAAGGGIIFFPYGTYLIGTAITIPANVVLMGSGKGNTTLKRGFTGNFATQAGYSGLMYLTIDGDTASQGAGKGVVFSGSTPSAYHLLVEIKNFVEPCLEFGADAGATFRGITSDYYTTGAVGSVGAVTVNGTDTAATSRHFIGCESGGCTLYDFGGANDFYVTGGFSNLLIFGAAGSKIFINNMRIGNAGTTTISSDNCRLADCVFAGPVVISGTGNHFDCEVPSWNITDSGTTNYITHPAVTYTSSWTSSGTAPSLGNGTLNAYYSRQGEKIKVTIDFTIGSTSTVGTGAWRFSLPRADEAAIVQMCGSGWCTNAASTAAATFAVRVSPGNQYVELFYADSSEAPQNVGATTPAATWGTGATVRFSCEYITT